MDIKMTTRTYKYKGSPLNHCYVPGEVYELTIRKTMFRRIKIESTDPEIMLSRRKYRNWYAFRGDWGIVNKGERNV